MKRRFEVLRHADLQTKEEIARLCPPGDSRRLDRIFETCMRKLNAETDEAEEIPERRRPQWMYAVIAASCLLICGGTAAAIGTLNAMTPPPAEHLTAEVTQAISSETTASAPAVVPVTEPTASEDREDPVPTPTEATAIETEAAIADTTETAPQTVQETAETTSGIAEEKTAAVTETEVEQALESLPFVTGTLPFEPSELGTETQTVTAEQYELQRQYMTPTETDGTAKLMLQNPTHAETLSTLYKLGWLPEGMEFTYSGDDSTITGTCTFTRGNRLLNYTETGVTTERMNVCFEQYPQADSITLDDRGVWEEVSVAGHPGWLFTMTSELPWTLYQLYWDHGDCYCSILVSKFAAADMKEDVIRMAASIVPDDRMYLHWDKRFPLPEESAKDAGD